MQKQKVYTVENKVLAPKKGEFFADISGCIIEIVSDASEDGHVVYKNLNSGRWDNTEFVINYNHFPYLFSNKICLPKVLEVLLK
jgi:hypothetical protein